MNLLILSIPFLTVKKNLRTKSALLRTEKDPLASRLHKFSDKPKRRTASLATASLMSVFNDIHYCGVSDPC